eukprot:scaffold1954_cov268-Pinguiococcus_pyrenoidosus.AAC.95
MLSSCHGCSDRRKQLRDPSPTPPLPLLSREKRFGMEGTPQRQKAAALSTARLRLLPAPPARLRAVEARRGDTQWVQQLTACVARMCCRRDRSKMQLQCKLSPSRLTESGREG